MTSILKVDTLQTAAGGVPTVGDLGINTTGSVLQRQFVEPLRIAETGHNNANRYSPSSDVWVTPNASGLDYQITFNAKDPSSKVLIEASGSTYGNGGGGWAGLYQNRIIATDGTNYQWPEWRQAAYSTTSNHTSFNIRRYFSSSTWDGKTFDFQIKIHPNNNITFSMFEDLMLTVTEIKQ